MQEFLKICEALPNLASRDVSVKMLLACSSAVCKIWFSLEGFLCKRRVSFCTMQELFSEMFTTKTTNGYFF